MSCGFCLLCTFTHTYIHNTILKKTWDVSGESETRIYTHFSFMYVFKNVSHADTSPGAFCSMWGWWETCSRGVMNCARGLKNSRAFFKGLVAMEQCSPGRWYDTGAYGCLNFPVIARGLPTISY